MKYPIRAVLPVVAIMAIGAVACDDDSDPTTVTSQARVRFVNAITDVSGNILLTANNTAVGAPLAFGAAAGTCTLVNAGATNLAFGTPNTGGTGIATSIGTATQTFAANGDFTILATGTAANPQLLVFNNRPTTTPTAGNAALRIVSAVPGTTMFDVFATVPGGTLTTPIVSDLAFGTTNNAFVTVPVGATQLTFTEAGTTDVIFTVPTQLSLTSGAARTVVLLPTTTGAGFQMVTLQGC